MALTTEERDALPDSDFAVPSKRALPIQDTTHCRMAWSMLDHTKGLTEAEKAEAKRRILKRAHELGIDTSKWEAHRGGRLDMQPGGPHDGGPVPMHFEAMALNVPDVVGHPNRVPFSGVLTRIDSASDNPVGGANGKRVLIPTAIAEAALSSLLGMAVDYTEALDGHNAQAKIGLITAAHIEGDAINIEGFLYGADFPAVVADIQSRTKLLGFSYEAQAAVKDWNSDPVEVTSCVFTGAAILLKDKAAYTSTSLSATAALEISDMDGKEILAQLAEIKAQNKTLAEANAALMATVGKLQASSVLDKVKPHSDAIRAAADGMEKDGMGMHDKRGHVRHLREMADRMDSDAVMGKLPHILVTDNWFDASATEALTQKVATLEGELKAEKDKVEKLTFAAAQSPERKTVATLIPKPAITATGEKPDYVALDAAAKAAGASTTDRLAALILARANA